MSVGPEQHFPIRLVVTDDLERSRPTVFFRLLLALPHLVWLALWAAAAFLVVFVAWLAVLFERRVPRTLHDFLASYVRYTTHVLAYLFLAAGPFPGFTGRPGYPVDVEIDPPQAQGRWGAGFRLVLALPALLLAAALSGGGGGGSGSGSTGVAGSAGFLAWFACLARGRMPRGLRDLIAYALGYGAQAWCYAFLLTDHYPSADPARVEPPAELPPHPVRIAVGDGLERSRLTVFFRALLAIPHFVWLVLWGVPAVLALIAAWLVALVTGRVPVALHRFLAAYTRYEAHVYAFFTIVGGPFPGFVGRQGSYPVELEIDGPVRQRRAVTLFRLLLALPALLLAGALGGALFAVAVLGWWYALFTGRMPAGLRDLGAACIRYSSQTSAYLALLTERYPYAAPVLLPPGPAGQPTGGVEPPEVAAGEPA